LCARIAALGDAGVYYAQSEYRNERTCVASPGTLSIIP
jgi:hypothetical protein